LHFRKKEKKKEKTGKKSLDKLQDIVQARRAAGGIMMAGKITFPTSTVFDS